MAECVKKLQRLEKHARDYHEDLDKEFVEVKHALYKYKHERHTAEETEPVVNEINKLIELEKDLEKDHEDTIRKTEDVLNELVSCRVTPGRQGAHGSTVPDSGFESAIIAHPEEDLRISWQHVGSTLLCQPQDSVEETEEVSTNGSPEELSTYVSAEEESCSP